MSNGKTVILGAGLAGLSAAYHGDGIVYEKKNIAGGTCVSPNTGGYIFDLGIHVLHTKDAYVLDLLLRQLNCKMELQRRSAWIYSNGVMTKYPFQVNTFGLPEAIKKECVEDFKKVYKKRDAKRHYQNYEEWVYSKFGKGTAEHFYLPYSEKFWTVSAKEMTTDWLDVRVPVPSLEEVIAGSRSFHKNEYGPNVVFRYPLESGISKLPESFLPKVKNRVFLNKEAFSLNLQNKSVTFKDKTTVSYERLINTIPLPELVAMIKEPVPSEVIDAVRGLKCNSILCVNLGIKRSDIYKAHWIYYPESDYSFFRISFPKNFCNVLAPKNTSSITAEIAYSKYKDVDRRNITDIVVKDLIKANILRQKDKIEITDVQDVKYGYPIYDHTRKKNVSIIENYLNKFDIHTAGRYGRWEYQWMDDAILDGKRVVTEVKKNESPVYSTISR